MAIWPRRDVLFYSWTWNFGADIAKMAKDMLNLYHIRDSAHCVRLGPTYDF